MSESTAQQEQIEPWMLAFVIVAGVLGFSLASAAELGVLGGGLCAGLGVAVGGLLYRTVYKQRSALKAAVLLCMVGVFVAIGVLFVW